MKITQKGARLRREADAEAEAFIAAAEAEAVIAEMGGQLKKVGWKLYVAQVGGSTTDHSA